MINLDKILRALSIPYSTRETGNKIAYVVECPYCVKGKHKDASGAFFAGQQHISYTCWRGCRPDRGGSYTVLSELSGLSMKEVLAVVEEYSDDILSKKASTMRSKGLLRPLDIGLDKTYREYLKARGFVPETLSNKWELIYTPHTYYMYSNKEDDTGLRLDNNIIFPVYDKWGTLLTFSGRIITPSSKRYTIPRKEDEVTSIKTTGVGFSHCSSSTLVITEGAFDAAKIGGVACCGISYTTGFVQTVIDYWKKHHCDVYVMFDNEIKAKRAQTKMENELALIIGNSLKKYKYPYEHDLGDCTYEEIRRIYKDIGVEDEPIWIDKEWKR